LRVTITGSLPTDETFASAVDVRRFVNDSIRDTAERFGGDSETVYDFVCECGDLRCRQLVSLTLAEYDESEAGSVQTH
jgi:hypothetical protein